MKTSVKLITALFLSLFIWPETSDCQAQIRVPTRPQRPVELTPAARDRLNAAAVRRIDDAMNAELALVRRQSAGSGMLVGIVKDNQIIHLKAYGFLNEADRTPMTLDTQLSWASISKVITAVVTWQQIADRNIDLSLTTRTSNVLDYWIERGATDRANKSRVTVDQLLTHTSGVGHYTSTPANRDISNQDWSDHYRRLRTIKPVDWNARQSVTYYRDKAIGAGNSGNYEYTTFGTCILAAMLDKNARDATNNRLNYTSWVQDKVAERAGMTNLRISPKFRHNLPGAGWTSNVEDLTKFMHALMNDRLVPITSLTESIKPGRGAGNHYGRGLYRRSIGGQLYIGHRGLQSGSRTSMLILANHRETRPIGARGPIKHVYSADREKFGVVIMINDEARSVDMDRITQAAYDATH